jgi:hypothetical protein
MQEAARRTWDELSQDLIDRQCADFHNKCRLVLQFHGKNCFNG